MYVLVHTCVNMNVNFCVHEHVYTCMSIGVHIYLGLYFTQFCVAGNIQSYRGFVMSVGFVALEPDMLGLMTQK